MPLWTAPGRSADGSTYGTALSAGTFHIGDSDGTISGTANADRFGRQVTIIQDLNGDGYGELLASLYSANSEALDLGWEGPGAGSVSLPARCRVPWI